MGKGRGKGKGKAEVTSKCRAYALSGRLHTRSEAKIEPRQQRRYLYAFEYALRVALQLPGSFNEASCTLPGDVRRQAFRWLLVASFGASFDDEEPGDFVVAEMQANFLWLLDQPVRPLEIPVGQGSSSSRDPRWLSPCTD